MGFGAIVRGMEVVILAYFLLLNGVYILLFLVAFPSVRAQYLRGLYADYDDLFQSPLTPAISIVLPARDEESVIAVTVNNLLHLDYPRYEVIVVNDGSSDGTLERLRSNFDLAPSREAVGGVLATAPVRGVYRSPRHDNLLVIDKAPSGKADALNAGLNAARHPYFCSIDADDILEPDALLRLVRHVVESPVRVLAIGGVIRVMNGCGIREGRIESIDLSRRPLVVFQVVEYFRAFLFGRIGFSRLNALLIISGAFGVFERDPVMAVGGYRLDTVGEDLDLVLRLHQYMREGRRGDYRVAIVADAMCWTQAPATWSVLSVQRRRWQRGLLEAMSRHREMFFNPRYGMAGLFAYPFLWLFEGWGAILEAAGYLLLVVAAARGAAGGAYLAGFFLVAVLWGAALSLCSVLLGEILQRRYPRFAHLAELLFFAFAENLGYRQINTFMRLRGTIDHLLGEGEWGAMRRARRSGARVSRSLSLLAAAVLSASARAAVAPPERGDAARYDLRLAASDERYSFAGPGNIAAISFRDRDFRGWDAEADAAAVRRYGHDDAEAGIRAAHALGSRRAYAGFSAGGGGGLLLPSARGAAIGGAPLALGAWWEGEVFLRRYAGGDVYGLAPILFRDADAVRVSAGYTLLEARYEGGGRSGWLSSFQAKGEYVGRSAFRPWALYARTREPFEAGNASVRDFSADHYGAGVVYELASGVGLEASFLYENRSSLDERVRTVSAGLVYSWGSRTGVKMP